MSPEVVEGPANGPEVDGVPGPGVRKADCGSGGATGGPNFSW